MQSKLKTFFPLAMRKFLKTFYNHVWLSRHYDSIPFGAWWSIWHRVYKTESMTFELPFTMMPIGFRSRFYFDTYELGERALAKKYLDKHDSIFELGGCLGIVSCVCNKQLAKPTKHVVVEANPELISWIKANRDKNDAHFHVEHGLLSKASNGDFHIHPLIVSGSATLEGGVTVTVPVFSIDDLCTKYGFVPSALVMDIEGGEVAFLEENFEWLRRNPSLNKLIVEVHPFIVGQQSVDHFHTQLRDLGFCNQAKLGTVEAWIREP